MVMKDRFDELSGRRVIIISNRLPVSVSKENGELKISPSSGGLATGLASYHREREGVWIGWPGYNPNTEKEKTELKNRLLKEFNCYPVYLSNLEIKKYYNGFSNNTLWPLFHYFTDKCSYDPTEWDFYKGVNEKYCRSLLEVVRPDDIIWIQDYHLMLLPEIVRRKIPEATIGFFLHIPFPSMEVFRYLPWRNEILEGILGADLIGFHTYDYSRHFLSCVLRILGKEQNYGQIVADNRVVKVDTFPMGIDAAKFIETVGTEEVEAEINNLMENIEKNKVILSVDRLDFTKGIPERLKAFEAFLEQYPDWRGKVTYIMLCVPSRDKIQQYQLLKKEVDELVGRINGRFAAPGWSPIFYMYRSIPLTALVSLYTSADLALVTPLRDGMNLVSKEYLACQGQVKNGMLVLSETAGSAAELGEAIIVNPNNINSIAEAIHQGLTMPEEDKKSALKLMINRIKRYNVFRWADDFVEQLLKVKENQEHNEQRLLTGRLKRELLTGYEQATNRLLLLDYDGTLVSFKKKPEQAKPDEELLTLLKELAADVKNRVVVISGRDRDSLWKWLAGTKVDLVAEHGAWIRDYDFTDWESTQKGNATDWKANIYPLLEVFAERTPGAFIEEKSSALVWHYRNSEPELGSLRAKELVDNIRVMLNATGLQVLSGNKVIEVKPVDINKGKAAAIWLEKDDWDFILGMGDDWTDEDIFTILPEDAWSVKVGFAAFTKAHYYLESQDAARSLLNSLAEISKKVLVG
jgi:trehalose 6-phosphate synthase/phosphatase